MANQHEDITTATTTKALAELLDHYCHNHNLPYQSADELLLEVLARKNDLNRHAQWLLNYIDQWNAVQDQEDSEAECRLNGHRDTGRGVCATCGTYT